jgi:creatinine amidohydrolase
MRLSEMTWRDVRDYLERSDALIVPVGTCEQHGPHLPLSTDTLIAEAFSAALSEATGVLVAPTLAYGINLPCDRYVPGNAGLTFDALRSSMGALLSDWQRQGFGTFFVLTAHACASAGFGFAHHEALKEAALPLLERGAASAYILFPFWTDIGDLLDGQSGLGHACEAETSIALHLFPELVRSDLISDPAPWSGVTRYDPYIGGVAHEAPAPDWQGGSGRPSLATAAKGAAIFARCLAALTEFVKEKMPQEGLS